MITLTSNPLPSGAHISDSLVEYLATLQADLDHLTTFGSDGANNMAGWENGAGKHFENALKRPLQRVVCLFHENELPLRALFCYLDGSTQGNLKLLARPNFQFNNETYFNPPSPFTANPPPPNTTTHAHMTTFCTVFHQF